METERLGRRGRRMVEDRVSGWGWGGMLILGVRGGGGGGGGGGEM